MADASSNSPRLPVTAHPVAKFQPAPDSKREKRKEPAKPSESENGPESASAEQNGDDLSPERWQELVRALRLHRRRLLRFPGVTAVDLGYKITEGVFTDTLAVRVHVEYKKDPGYLKQRKHELIPEWVEPDKVREPATRSERSVPVDIIEANYRISAITSLPRRGAALERPRKLSEVNRRLRLDPLVGGISIGNPFMPVGTLGALVWDKTDGSVCILSNWHVLAGSLQAEVGTPCFQPGLFDQGRSSDVVARLKRWSFDGQTDAAIAELTGSRHYCAGEILLLFQQIAGVCNPHLGMEVLKSGRSTGVTQGFIDGLFFSTAIEYGGGFLQMFEDQIHIAPLRPEDESTPVESISAPGDSGAVWVTKNSHGYLAVGLHFAGDLPHSAFGEYALANPMTIVKRRLNFSFRPLFLEVRDEDVASPRVQIEQHSTRVGPVGVIGGGSLTGSGDQGDPRPINPGGGGTG